MTITEKNLHNNRRIPMSFYTKGFPMKTTHEHLLYKTPRKLALSMALIVFVGAGCTFEPGGIPHGV